MFDEPPRPVTETPPAATATEVPGGAALYTERPDGTVVIDLTRLVPPPAAEDCPEPDPFQADIVVCTAAPPAPRLGPRVGPVDDGFARAIPLARIKLSENASAEANLHNTPVGGFNANGGEVRLKIGF